MRKISSVIIGKLFPKILLFLLPFFLGLNLNGQTLDLDSAKIVEVDANVEVVHSPKKATIYSAILPGLGQAYNKKYWKIPLIYAGFGTIGYFIFWNNDNYNIMRTAYVDLTQDTGNSYLDFKPEWVDLDNATDVENFKTSISKQQDYYRRNRDLLIIGMVGFYGLNIIDASVDAHLFDFDMGDDLTFNWQPTMQSLNRQTHYGINCTFTF